MRNRLISVFAFLGLAAMAALPEGATRLDYIQGDGKSYFLTDWTPVLATDRFEATVALTASENLMLWCTRERNGAGNSRSVSMCHYGTTCIRSDYHATSREMSRTIPLALNTPYTISVFDTVTLVSNGARADHTPIAGFTEAPGPMVLFASCYWTNGVAESIEFIGKHQLMSFKVWRGDDLLHDWVPVKTADNLVTLADAVDGTTLTPQGTGAFIAGPAADLRPIPLAATIPTQYVFPGHREPNPVLAVTDAETGAALLPEVDYTVAYVENDREGTATATITPTSWSAHGGERPTTITFPVLTALPDGYERLEYIQGDGRTCLPTDYRQVLATDTLEVEYAFTKLETVGTWCARAKTSGSGANAYSLCFLKNAYFVYRFDYANVQKQLTPPLVAGVRYVVQAKGKTLWVSNGNSLQVLDTDNAEAPAQAGGNLMIGAYYDSPTAYNPSSFTTQRFYAFRVKRSNTLIHNWVPVRTPTGVVTLFDMVDGTELTPKGSGAFIAGPALQQPASVEIAPIPVQELPAGGACEPVPVVTDLGLNARLTAGTDFTVSYADNDAPGLATLIVTGAGAYAGRLSATVPFHVSPASPAGLTRLDYIQGDGKTRLLTDWTVNPQTDRVETEIELTDVVNAGIWCSRGVDTGDRSFTLFRLSGGTFRCDCATVGNITIGWNGTFPLGVKLPIRAQGGNFRIGDVHNNRNVGASFTQAGGPLMLFASYYNGTGSNIDFVSKHRLYEFRVFRGGRLVRRWVPVRTAGGVATVCELMTGTTLTPIGAGAFIAGPQLADFGLSVADQSWDGEKRVKPIVGVTNLTTGVALAEGSEYRLDFSGVTGEGWGRATATGAEGSAYAGQARSADFRVRRQLPEGYERLEYLQGDGKTSLLTDYTPHPKTDVISLDFEIRRTGSWSGLLCARRTALNGSLAFCGAVDGVSFRFDCALSNLNWRVSGKNGSVGARHVVHVGNLSAVLDSGESIYAGANCVQNEAGGPLMLLAYYDNSTNLTPASQSTDRVYGCQVTRSGTLLHDWVPVRTPTGVVTFYDRVTEEELTPRGGTLIPGPAWEHDDPIIPPPGTVIIIR